MIELSEITKTFNAGKPNAFTALKGIGLTVDKRKITVFRGPSGSGKTTLLSIIGCMSRPTTGRIRLDGREITSLPERFTAEIHRSTFGFIFQSYNLIKGISVLENVMIPAYPTGLAFRKLKDRAMALLAGLDIQAKASQAVENLSGGEQQRTAIARALINDPPCLIADEPTAHLDTDLAGSFLEIIYKLRDEGKTILISSHDPLVYQSPRIDRIIHLRDGRIVGQGAAP